MRQWSIRTRVVAALATLALGGGTAGVLMASTAGAAGELAATVTAVADPIDHPEAQPTVLIGQTGQDAGYLHITYGAAISEGSTITLFIDDSDSAVIPLDDNCYDLADSVGFTAVPTITQANATGAKFAGALAKTAGCVQNNKPYTDILVLTATTASATGTDFFLTGVKLDIGLGAAAGPIAIRKGAQNTPVVASNAFVSAVKVGLVDNAGAAVTAPLLGKGANQLLPRIQLTELRKGTLTNAGICIDLTKDTVKVDAGTATFTNAVPSQPLSVNESLDAATVSPPTIVNGGNTISAVITGAPTSAPGTVIINNVHIDSFANGPIDASVGVGAPGCAGPSNEYSRSTRLAFVGGVTKLFPAGFFYPPVDRYNGTNRYATAARVARDNFGDLSGTNVVVARGDNFPDALAASYVAGINNSVVLLTRTGDVPAETLQALKEHGARNVLVMGGTQAVSQAAFDQLDKTCAYDYASQTCIPNPFIPNEFTSLTVTRIGGADRYETARLAAELPTIIEPGIGEVDLSPANGACNNSVPTAIVASGENFPDALAAGGLAYGGIKGQACSARSDNAIPMLLTRAGSLSPSVVDGISHLGAQQVILMGGTTAISTAVENAIDNLPNVTVVRIAGANRQATAVALAQSILGPTTVGNFHTGFLVSRPDDFADALAASSVSGLRGWPVYLADAQASLGATSTAGIQNFTSSFYYEQGIALGGTVALSDQVLYDMAAAIVSQLP